MGREYTNNVSWSASLSEEWPITFIKEELTLVKVKPAEWQQRKWTTWRLYSLDGNLC